jgi:hypothetical protein
MTADARLSVVRDESASRRRLAERYFSRWARDFERAGSMVCREVLVRASRDVM